MTTSGNSTSESRHEDQSGRVPCAVCREPIRVGARKCISCSSFQHPVRRLMGLGDTTLALLIALCSVLSYSVPVLKDAFTPKRDDIRVRLMGIDAKARRLDLFVSNLGTRPGAIGSVWVAVPPELAARSTTPGWQLDLPEDTSINPGRSYHFTFSSSEIPLPEPAHDLDPGQVFTLTVTVIRFNGTRHEIEIPLRAIARR